MCTFFHNNRILWYHIFYLSLHIHHLNNFYFRIRLFLYLLEVWGILIYFINSFCNNNGKLLYSSIFFISYLHLPIYVSCKTIALNKSTVLASHATCSLTCQSGQKSKILINLLFFIRLLKKRFDNQLFDFETNPNQSNSTNVTNPCHVARLVCEWHACEPAPSHASVELDGLLLVHTETHRDVGSHPCSHALLVLWASQKT